MDQQTSPIELENDYCEYIVFIPPKKEASWFVRYPFWGFFGHAKFQLFEEGIIISGERVASGCLFFIMKSLVVSAVLILLLTKAIAPMWCFLLGGMGMFAMQTLQRTPGEITLPFASLEVNVGSDFFCSENEEYREIKVTATIFDRKVKQKIRFESHTQAKEFYRDLLQRKNSEDLSSVDKKHLALLADINVNNQKRINTVKRNSRILIRIKMFVAVCILIAFVLQILFSYIQQRISENEKAAVYFLNYLVNAQLVFKNSGCCDQNNNGSGEYGFLQELAGVVEVRGRNQYMDPPFIDENSFENDLLEFNGYYYCCYLPGDEKAISFSEIAVAKSDEHVIESQESYFIIYAWPTINKGTGRKAFAINQEGEFVYTREHQYSGEYSVPLANAAFHKDAFDSGNVKGILAKSSRGLDGNEWLPGR
ncbi:hypothetical protein [Candidatus Uabimicrobium amorphum]|uniref:Uncharacterized protein n=1 Tax=Uabimicrobium amorphum TaxID=2596890 RepID=A0A5S9IQN3_UABAM|nr:hypothetical protein [Candidatus Uabimicrobium amorphum]BBM86299.1 hypothetical protein UABAM_04685 [Candidatus Uabimicrobium amorphum]